MFTLSRLRSLSIAVLLAAPACNDGNPQLTTNTAGECPAGSQGCPCISDGCFGGLECLGGVCIDPGGADSNPPGTESASSATSTSDATNVTQTTVPTSDSASETGVPTTTRGDPTTGSVTPDTTTSGEPPQTTSTTLPPDETDAGDESVGFIPSDTGEPPGGDCDIFDQDCPVGQKCMPYADGGSSWNALKCSKIDPTPDKVGATCSVVDSGVSGEDSCAAGSMCFNVPPGEVDGGYCVAFCKGTADDPTCADPKSTCIVSNEGVLALCLPTCDPLASTCKAGQVCVPNTQAGNFVCFIDASDGANQGDPCQYANACSPGFICINGPFVQNCNSQACCTAFCDLELANNCVGKPTVECIPYYEEGQAPPGFEDVGICGIP